MRHEWHVRRGYRKIHVAVDIKKKRILWVGAVTTEEVHDCKMLTILLLKTIKLALQYKKYVL